jgi:predicted nucleic acid-binding protein
MPTGSTATAADGTTFVDTNVLVYAHDARDPRKQRMARAALTQLWDARAGIVSTQVLQEFYVVATAPHKLAMKPAQARELIELYSTWTVVLIEPALLLNASRLHERRSVSFWDALIVEAARVAGAARILSEDFAGGGTIDDIAIVDPFGVAAAHPSPTDG